MSLLKTAAALPAVLISRNEKDSRPFPIYAFASIDEPSGSVR